jgi:hypothetical protein
VSAAFVIILTFMVGIGTSSRTIKCPDMACVHNVIAAAWESRLLSRLRVFKGEAGLLPAGGSVFPPTIEMWFQ